MVDQNTLLGLLLPQPILFLSQLEYLLVVADKGTAPGLSSPHGAQRVLDRFEVCLNIRVESFVDIHFELGHQWVGG